MAMKAPMKTVKDIASTGTVPEKEANSRTLVESKDGEVLPPLKHTTSALREAIFDEMNLIRSGKSSSTRANAMARLVTAVIESKHLEMAMERHAKAFPNADSDIQGPTPKDLD